jgi:hypothetical protein
MFNFRGINFWHLANSVGWNILWTGISLLIIFFVLGKTQQSLLLLQLVLMVSIFVGSLTAGLLFGRLAADGRGLTYGVVGSLGSVLLSLIFILPSGGFLGIMLAVIAIAGGINGGLLSLRRYPLP